MSGRTIYSGGRVVLNRVIVDIADAARRRGVDLGPAFAGLSFTEAEIVADPRGRVPWDDFAVFIDRVEEAAGGPAASEEIYAGVVSTRPALRFLASLVVGPAGLYDLGARVARHLYGDALGTRIDVIDDGRLRFESRIPDDRRDSIAFFHGSIGGLRAYPRLVGQPDAIVEAERQGRRHVFLVSPPVWETAATRLVTSLELPLAELLRARAGGLEPSAADVLEAIEIGYGEVRYREAANAVGARLLAAGSAEAAAEELRAVLDEQLCCRSFELWVRRGREGLRLLASGAPSEGPRRRVEIPLAVGGREVGRLDLDLAPPLNDDSRRLVEALVPWIAAALDANPPERGPRPVGLAGLPPRLGQIARLLCAGVTEKQIADRTGLSLQSVRTYVKRLYGRLGVRNRAELVASVIAGNRSMAPG